MTSERDEGSTSQGLAAVDELVGSEPSGGPAGVEAALEAFIAKQHPAMQPIVRRHGTELFQFCLDTGGIGGCFGEIRQVCLAAFQALAGGEHPNRQRVALAQGLDKRATQAIGVAERLANKFAAEIAQHAGWDLQAIRECQGDIARAAQLMQAEPGRSPAGLILPPH